jgi:hypothetical protein
MLNFIANLQTLLFQFYGYLRFICFLNLEVSGKTSYFSLSTPQ